MVMQDRWRARPLRIEWPMNCAAKAGAIHEKTDLALATAAASTAAVVILNGTRVAAAQRDPTVPSRGSPYQPAPDVGVDALREIHIFRHCLVPLNPAD